MTRTAPTRGPRPTRPPRSAGRRGGVVAALALAALAAVLPACAGGAGNRAAGLLPRETIGVFTVALEPAIEQKRALATVLSQFPVEAARKEFTDQVDAFLTELFKLVGLSYTREVKPWLGPEVTLAIVSGGANKTPVPVLVLPTNDEEQSRKSLEGARSSGFTGGFRVLSGHVLVSTAGAGEDAVIRLADDPPTEERSLARHQPYERLVARMREDRLVLGWVDGQRAFSALADSVPDFGSIRVQELFGQGGQGGAFAFTLHAADRSVVLESFAEGEAAQRPAKAPELTESLPARTSAAFTMFDLGAAGSTANLPAGGEEIDAALDELAKESGVDIRRDLFSWMHGELALVAGELDPAGFPDLAVVAEVTDRPAAEAGLQRVRDALERSGESRFVPLEVAGGAAYQLAEPISEGLQPAMGLFGDRFVLATDGAYLTALANPAKDGLAATDEYRRAFGGSSGKAVELQLLVLGEPVRRYFEGILDPANLRSYQDRGAPFLRPVEAVSLRTVREEGGTRLVVRLSVQKPPEKPEGETQE